MRKFFSIIFLIVSLVTIVTMSIAFDTIFSNVYASSGISLSDFFASLSEMDIKEILSAIGIIMIAFMQIFGIPIVIFLVSLIGLCPPKLKVQKSMFDE